MNYTVTQSSVNDSSTGKYRKIAETMLKELAATHDTVLSNDMRFVGQIYGREMEAALEGLERYHDQHGSTLVYDFYRGEMALLTGDLTVAAEAYHRVLDREAPQVTADYQIFASYRLADIRGAAGDYDGAREHIKQAPGLPLCGPLVELMTKARERYYERLGKAQSR